MNSIFLGIVGGFCEFLPVSGPGHLALLHTLFQIDEVTPLFNVILHLGYLIAILVTYHADLLNAWQGGKEIAFHSRTERYYSQNSKDNRRIFVYIILGTLPLFPTLLLRKLSGLLSLSTLFVSIMLLVNGSFIFYANQNSRASKNEDKITILDAITVGFAQLLSIFPGISRVGFTISAGLLQGFPRKFALKFAFMLRVPSLIACILLYIIESIRSGANLVLVPEYLVASALGAVAGVFSIRFLRWIISRNSFVTFAYYCWGAGIVSLLLSLIS